MDGDTLLGLVVLWLAIAMLATGGVLCIRDAVSVALHARKHQPARPVEQFTPLRGRWLDYVWASMQLGFGVLLLLPVPPLLWWLFSYKW